MLDEGKIIGIDLGTIFSCVGIMRNGRVDIVPEANTGNNIIPSTVYFTPTKTLIGFLNHLCLKVIDYLDINI